MQPELNYQRYREGTVRTPLNEVNEMSYGCPPPPLYSLKSMPQKKSRNTVTL
jgi:hypothetical protein